MLLYMHSSEEMVPVYGWLPGTGVLPIRRAAENAEQLTSTWKGLEPRSGPSSTPLQPSSTQVKSQKESTPRASSCSRHFGVQGFTACHCNAACPAFHKQGRNLSVRHVIYFAFPFLLDTSVDSVCHFLGTGAFLSGLCYILAAITFPSM